MHCNHQILTLNSYGAPHDWVSWEEAICLKVKGLIQYELGDDEITARGGVSRMTGERSHVEVKNIIGLKGDFKFDRRPVALTNPNLFARDLHTCSYCGRFGGEDKLTRDHIVPRSKGGKDIWTNVVTACKRCNNAKDDMSLAQAGMELIWVPYTPVREEGLIMANRRILFDQAEFIRNFLPEKSRMHTYLDRKFAN